MVSTNHNSEKTAFFYLLEEGKRSEQLLFLHELFYGNIIIRNQRITVQVMLGSILGYEPEHDTIYSILVGSCPTFFLSYAPNYLYRWRSLYTFIESLSKAIGTSLTVTVTICDQNDGCELFCINVLGPNYDTSRLNPKPFGQNRVDASA